MGVLLSFPTLFEYNTHPTLSEFNVTQMKKHCAFLVIGKHQCGKTALLKDIYNKLDSQNKFNKVIYVSNQTGKKCFDLNSVVECGADGLENTSIPTEGDNLILVDDCIYSVEDKSHFKRLLMNCRHMNTMLGVTDQSILNIKSMLRANFDYIFYFGNSSDESNHILSSTYGVEPEVLANLKQFQCVVIDTTHTNPVVSVYGGTK